MPPKKKHKTVQPRLFERLDPNELTEAILPEHFLVLSMTCKFLGQHYSEGELICYDENEYICRAGHWNSTGSRCS